MQLLDEDTVSEVQLRCPMYCQEDSDKVARLMRKWQIFLAIQDIHQRRKILKRLHRIPYLIPSLYSLQQDYMYISSPAKIMRQIFNPTKKRLKGTIRDAAQNAFSGVNQKRGQFFVQSSDKTFTTYQGNDDDQLEFGFQTLYLYAMRHVFEMVSECPLKERGEPTPVPKPRDLQMWYNFGSLAYRLGFESPEIERLKALDPDKEKARQSLLLGRGPDRYRYDDDDFERFTDIIARMYRTAKEIQPPTPGPLVLVDGPGESLERRCGRHRSKAYEYDRYFLFLEVLNNPVDGKGNSISSLFVRKSVYFAFFGSLASTLHGDGPHNDPKGPDVDMEMILPPISGTSPKSDREMESPKSDYETESPEPSSTVVHQMINNEVALEPDAEMPDAPVKPKLRKWQYGGNLERQARTRSRSPPRTPNGWRDLSRSRQYRSRERLCRREESGDEANQRPRRTGRTPPARFHRARLQGPNYQVSSSTSFRALANVLKGHRPCATALHTD